jgi:HD-GYP domain-containing protein (c-di-GMP phosphodiesterase class II)
MRSSTHDLIGSLFNHCPNTFRHSLRVGDHLYGFADFLNMENCESLFLLGALHDIGKIKIPASLLNKTEPLTLQEYEEVKRHTVYGENIIKKVKKFPVDYPKVILYHHENLDSSGYFHLPEKDIPHLSKIIRIIDSYDTMLYGRIYQEPVRQEDVLEEMYTLIGKHYDKVLMEAFSEFLQTKYALKPFMVLEKHSGTW